MGVLSFKLKPKAVNTTCFSWSLSGKFCKQYSFKTACVPSLALTVTCAPRTKYAPRLLMLMLSKNFWLCVSNITGGVFISMLPSTTICFALSGISISTSLVHDGSKKNNPTVAATAKEKSNLPTVLSGGLICANGLLTSIKI